MKHTVSLLGVGCAACCAVPLVLPLLGAGALGTAWIKPELALGLSGALIVAVLAIGIRRRKERAWPRTVHADAATT